MNRREAIHSLGILAFGVTAQSTAPASSGKEQDSAAVQSATSPLPSIVAGVRLVDS